MRDHLPVGEGGVGGAVRRREVVLALRRPERRAGQLLILHRNAVPPHGFLEHLEKIAGYLVAETAGPAVDHHHDLIVAGDPERRRCHGVKDPVVGGDLHLQVMVAGPQRAELMDPPRHRVVAHLRGVRSRNAAPLFDAGEILVPSVAVLHAPPSPLLHDLFKLGAIQPNKALRADAGRDFTE